MLHYITNLYKILWFNNLQNNNTTLKLYNRIIFVFIIFLYKIIFFLAKPFQKNLINVYGVFLQTDRLLSSSLVKNFEAMFIFFQNDSALKLLLSRVKNNSILRNTKKNKNIFMHNMCIHYNTTKFQYYNELNFTKLNDAEISNFYYNVQLKNTNNYFILFYFFNKIIFNHYSYFYQAYNNKNIKMLCSNLSLNKSVHLRIALLYIFINATKNCFNKSDISFSKNTLSTFKGVSNIFENKEEITNFVEKIHPYNLFNNYIIINVSDTLTNLKKTKLLLNVNNVSYLTFFLSIINSSVHLLKTKIYTIKPTIKSELMKTLKIIWYNKIHFSSYTMSKNITVLYLRSSRHFNKGRYSRNRQLYRTGVYWCIWLNIVLVYGLHYYFYRVVFSFGYLWLPLCVMILSIFSSRLYKYRYYSLYQLFLEIREYNNFLYILFFKAQIWLNFKATFLVNKLKYFFFNYHLLLLKIWK